MTLDEFFEDRQEARAIFDALQAAVDTIGPSDVRVSRSQVAFRRRANFAIAWTPDRYLRGTRPPLVLTIPLRNRDSSERWKQVVEAAPGRYTHHVELWSPDEVDGEILDRLRESWMEAR